MAEGDEASDLVAPVAKLTIDAQTPGLRDTSVKPAAPKSNDTQKKKKKKKQVVADSWEDEDVSSEDEETPSPPIPTNTKAASAAPVPPTAFSTPSYSGASSPSLSADWSKADPSASGSAPARRPEKTDVVARRLIAGALGIRVPQTAEQRAYNKSLLENERKKREKARAEKKQQEEEAEKVKKATWGE